MDQPVTASLHELVYAMDGYAERVLVRRFGVDRSLFAFLVPLAAGPLDVTRLAESLNLTKAAVSKRVRPLEREGWLTTSSDPHHGRRVVLTLTPRGRSLVAAAGGLLESRFSALLASGPIDPDTFHRQLRGLVEAVRALDPDQDLP
ncbi:MAG: MarR family transcriptional regulator [Propionicimonas sp.]|nr:MarR family transcriptional regulator [Propionicimonas sp.]